MDDDLVLFHNGKHEGFVLNGTAALVWQLADGKRTPSTMAREIARSYGVEYNDVLTDVREFLAELEDAGLLSSARKSPCALCP